ncbi:hypothetical protein HI914_00257 [Erysiphe necator]|nr:hypothetical protein HI914_00257 [Erysiphe necator]
MAGISNLEPKRYAYSKADLDKMKEVIYQSEWGKISELLVALQSALAKALNLHFTRARPSRFAKPEWSPEASSLFNDTRRARRLAVELGTSHNKFLLTYYNCERDITETPTNCDIQKETILQEKFFPGNVKTDLSDLVENQRPKQSVIIPNEVKPEEVECILSQLPQGKAPGPDEILNEIFQAHLPEWKLELARAITNLLVDGNILSWLKESITIALRKDRPSDYSLPSSYRPIALENSIANLVQKVVANQMMKAAEEHNILPWVQMGARKHRLTISALELLTSTVQNIWNVSPDRIILMLCLNIKGVFDNVSVKRLLWVL